MQQRVERPRPDGDVPNSTPNPEARKAADVTARMHFYVVHSAGDQLRWANASRKGKKPDRMVGR